MYNVRVTYIAVGDTCSIHMRFKSVHMACDKVAEWAKPLEKACCLVMSHFKAMRSNPATRT